MKPIIALTLLLTCVPFHAVPCIAQILPSHPRLLVTKKKFDFLKKAIADPNQPRFQLIWLSQVKPAADKLVKNGPPPYTPPTSSTDEMLWQRNVGDAMPILAMAYRLTGNQNYLNSAQSFAAASMGYLIWGAGSVDFPNYNGMNLAAAHQLFGLAIIYDWLYDDLPIDFRNQVYQQILNRGNVLFAGATGTAEWAQSFLQNHQWICNTALLAANLAIWGDNNPIGNPITSQLGWEQLALKDFAQTSSLLDPLGPQPLPTIDGASHEGVGYWEYGSRWELVFMDISRDLLGVDFYASNWWKNTANYRIYMSTPANAWIGSSKGVSPNNTVVNRADCWRIGFAGPDYQLFKLAHEYNNGYAQGFALQAEAAKIIVNEDGAPWLNLVWYDPNIQARNISNLSTAIEFKNWGMFSDRTNWSGNEDLLAFYAGPPLGHYVQSLGSGEEKLGRSAGHVHPDANSFSLFGSRWLIRNPGYLNGGTLNGTTLPARHSIYENTLRVNGTSQVRYTSDDAYGTDEFRLNPTLTVVEKSHDLDYLIGNATSAYGIWIGLTRFNRHLIFLKQMKVIILIDDIQLSQPRKLDLDLHPEISAVPDPNVPLSWLSTDSNAILRIQTFDPSVQVTSYDIQVQDESNGGGIEPLPTLTQEQSSASEWQNVTALSWSDNLTSNSNAPIIVKMIFHMAYSPIWAFDINGQTLTVDIFKETAVLK